MTTNETIVTWLGYEREDFINADGYPFTRYNKGKLTINNLDFLHDRNQQKWIEDKLIKKEYEFDIVYSKYYSDTDEKVWMFRIWYTRNDFITQVNKIKDTAFIKCVLELIEKENARTGSKEQPTNSDKFENWLRQKEGR